MTESTTEPMIESQTGPPTESTGLSRRNLIKSAGIAGAGLASIAAAPAVTGSLATAATSASAAGIAGGLDDVLRLVKVWATMEEQPMLGGFDDTHVQYPDGSIEFLLWPGDLAKLRQTGLRFELLETPQERHLAESLRLGQAAPIRTTRAPGQTDGEYRTLAEYNADMKMLADTYPDKCKLIVLPYRTLERRTVYGLEICTDVNRYDGRPVYYNDGCHHAREFPAAEVPMMWAYDLLLNYGEDARITQIMDNVRNIVVPVVNADGFDYARSAIVDTTDPVGSLALGATGREAYWRKNRRAYLGTHQGDPLLFSTADQNPFDAYGIDPNRNYAFGWGGDGSGVVFENQTYRGTQPFSEQESMNVDSVFGKYMVTAAISHHTSGDLLLWAWGDTRDDAPDNNLLEGIGRACATYNGYEPKKSIELYVTTGTASDHMYGSRTAISYTYEHAGSSFHPSYPATVPAMYEKNRTAMMFLCEQVCLLPENRPAYTDAELSQEAKVEMQVQGLKLDDLNHAVLRGSLPSAGTVRIFKRYTTQLWEQNYEDGNTGADNPLGQPDIDQFLDCEVATAADGTFEIHVNPSTQPKREALGQTELYEMTFATRDGLSGGRRMLVERGQIYDLGEIELGD
jgi:hypothetical protein